MIKAFKNGPAWLSPLFLATVVAPTVLAVLYYGLIASDVYTSQSSFVVRSPERQSTSALGGLLRGAGFSSTQNDSQTVHEYILSRDALKLLDEKLGIKNAYGSSKVDRFSRFSGFDPDESFEALHRYYQKMTLVDTDSASSITTLSVKAFTAEDALKANQLLLQQSEALVNRLNERGRQDMIKYALVEVAAASDKAKAAALTLSAYRNAQGVLDPERQASSQLQQVAKLQDELIATTMQLSQLEAFTPQNPQVASLQNRAKVLRNEINGENLKMTGGDKSLSSKTAEYQRLALDSEFANKQLASVMVSLETARSEAQRQQVYLERIAQPNLPDVAQEPRRLRGILATLALGLVAWGIFSMLIAGVREHQD